MADREDAVMDSKDAEYIVDREGAQPAPGFAEHLVGMSAGEEKRFSLTMPEDYRDKDVAGKPADFEITLHWAKERELPALDDEFAQQVGEYTDVAGLRTAIEAQLKQREADRVREKLEEDAIGKLVEISTIDFPPQLVESQAEYMLSSFKSNVERQGLQFPQYLRLIGKDEDAFRDDIRTEAETRVRRSLALDAFATAEHIDGNGQAAETDAEARSTRALARLVELATGGAAVTPDVEEKTANGAETSDTEGQTPLEDVEPDATTSTSEEERGTA
jgi:trigger factor